MTVLGPSKPALARRQFDARVRQGILISAGLLLALGIFLAWALHALSSTVVSTAFPALVALATSAYIAKEFYVRHAFNEERGRDAVLIHGALALALFAALAIAARVGQVLTLEGALLWYAIAHLVACILGNSRANIPKLRDSTQSLRECFRELRAGGKWATATNVVYGLRNQAHTVVVAALVGPAGVAKISAARLLVTPAILLIPALSQVALPRLARMMKSAGLRTLLRAQRKIIFALLSAAAIYSLLLLVLFPWIAPYTLGNAYTDILPITVAWCVFACALAIRSGVDWTTQALREFKSLTVINSFASLITLILAGALGWAFGPTGAITSLAISELYIFAHLTIIQRRKMANAAEK